MSLGVEAKCSYKKGKNEIPCYFGKIEKCVAQISQLRGIIRPLNLDSPNTVRII